MTASSRVSWMFVGVSIVLVGLAVALTSSHWIPRKSTAVVATGQTPTSLTIDESPVVANGVTWLALTKQIKGEMNPRLKDGLFGTPFGGQLIQDHGLGTITTESYELGTINDGIYAGYTLSEQHLLAGDLGERSFTFYLLERGSGITDETAPWTVILTKYSDVGGADDFPVSEIKAFMAKVDGALSDMSIAELDFGTKIEGGGNKLFVPALVTNHEEFTAERLVGAREFPVVGLTTDGRELRAYHRTEDMLDNRFYGHEGGIFIIRHDGHVVWYELDLGLWPASTTSASEGLVIHQSFFTAIPLVTIGEAAVSTNYLRGIAGGCEFSGLNHVVAKDDIPGLKVIGYVTGEPDQKIYGADYSDPSFDDEFSVWQNKQGRDVTREEFAAITPTFYYQDSLGRWLMFFHPAAVYAGECSRPAG